jgi:hypothetical protein
MLRISQMKVNMKTESKMPLPVVKQVDNDNDGTGDTNDKCPNQAGTANIADVLFLIRMAMALMTKR